MRSLFKSFHSAFIFLRLHLARSCRMLFPALLAIACLVPLSSGETLSTNSSVNDVQETTSYLSSTVLNADPAVSSQFETPSTTGTGESSTAPNPTLTPDWLAGETSAFPPVSTTATTQLVVATNGSPDTTVTILPVITPAITSSPSIAVSVPPTMAPSSPPMAVSVPPTMAPSSPSMAVSVPPTMAPSSPPMAVSVPPTMTPSSPSMAVSVPPTMAPSSSSTSVSVPPILASSSPPMAPPTMAPSSSPTSVSVPPMMASIPSIPSMAQVKSSSYLPSQPSLHEVPTTPASRTLATSSRHEQTVLSSQASVLQTVSAYPSADVSQQAQVVTADSTPLLVSVAVLAVLTLVFLVTTCVLSIALCVAICRFRARNLTYTIKNPEAKEGSRYWIEAKSNSSEGKGSPIRAEEGEKVWYTENATAFPVFPMAHQAVAKDPTDPSPSVQTFRLARAYRQSAGNNTSSSPQPLPAPGSVPAATSAPSPQAGTAGAESLNRATDGATVSRSTSDGGVSLGRTIVVPTTPTSESDLSKAKKRRPPPLKPITADSHEGTYTKQGGTSQPHNPTTPGSCSVHKSQVYTGPDPRAELMKEYAAILQAKQNTT